MDQLTNSVDHPFLNDELFGQSPTSAAMVSSHSKASSDDSAENEDAADNSNEGGVLVVNHAWMSLFSSEVTLTDLPRLRPTIPDHCEFIYDADE
jgi:hypothetical protein